MTERNDLMAQEYALLLENHENLAGRALTIKAWSVTFGASGLGLAYSSGERSIMLLAAFGASVFWLVETLIRGHQKAYEARIELLERHFRRDERAAPAPFQIFAAWWASFSARGRVTRAVKLAFYPHIMLPHVFMLLVGIGLFVGWAPDAEREAGPNVELIVR